MLEQLTIEMMQPHVGSSFWLIEGNHKVEMRLVQAAKVMESEAARLQRNPFSLFFLGPGSIRLPQKIYRLTHEAFPTPLDIFLVPVEQQQGGYLYEAVFT